MNTVLVQLITGEMLAVKRSDFEQKRFHNKPVRDLDFTRPGPSIALKFSYSPQPFIPGQWIEEQHISMKTDEPLIAVEMHTGDIVHVPIKWLMSGEPPWNSDWTIAYHPNGDAMTRHNKMDDMEFARSVRRQDVKRILG